MPLNERARKALEDLRRRAEGDPCVAGLVLTGSAAREPMATRRSDVDAYVVLQPGRASDAWTTRRTPAADEIVVTVDDLADPALPDRDQDRWWNRYSFAHAQVLLDRLDGRIEELVRAQAGLTVEESRRVLELYLDGYVNRAYRSVKSHCDERLLESHLDAAESLAWGLVTVFALEGRLRPYNKYLRWEVSTHPLERFPGRELMDLVERIVTTGEVDAQKRLFARVAAAAVADDRVSPTAGRLGDRWAETLDAWGEELDLLR